MRTQVLIDKICGRAPRLKALLNLRSGFSVEEFKTECDIELKNKTAYNYFERETLVNFLMYYDSDTLHFYEALQKNAFGYKNLDEDYIASPSRPLASRPDLDARDSQYAEKISQAYQEKQGVIVMLGGLHLLPPPKNSIHYPEYKDRQLISDRLQALKIPHIGLQTFRSNHTPSCELSKQWCKQVFPTYISPDPSIIYSIDVAKPEGINNFLQAIESLTQAHERANSQKNRLTR